MSEVTALLLAIDKGDKQAADKLLPMVYEELRRLAHMRLSREKPGQTLQATELVHEAYLRLMGTKEVDWNGAGHFFGAAAQAMRRILIERARRRRTAKHGGDRERIELDSQMMDVSRDEMLLKLDEALEGLQLYDPRKAEVVKLRFFAGLTNREAAAALGISEATADRDWVFSRAWLYKNISEA